MNILEKIVAHKKKEVEDRKSFFSVVELEKSAYFTYPVVSLKKALLNDEKTGIIAEYKRTSPSKGIINKEVLVEQTTSGYAKAGASALSILTDTEFFGGKNEDIISARKQNNIPILRKDFIVDEYQIIEAKSIGADVILLLANVLSAMEIKQFATTAKFLGMEVLLEIRNKSELKSVNVLVDCIGVNNRNLSDFSVNVNQSFLLAESIPKDFIKVSESGIDSAKTVHELKKVGFKGFLIGETFMKDKNPEIACANFIKEVKEYK
ncbi:MAG: indole-3-glycerol phosphate synthase TrpC [Bacteroidetes bacterium]|nr:indole-3-glycerol phosphate synthase TrpC [Bacteroidota bacterium]